MMWRKTTWLALQVEILYFAFANPISFGLPVQQLSHTFNLNVTAPSNLAFGQNLSYPPLSRLCDVLS